MEDLSHFQRLPVQGMVCVTAMLLTYVTISSYPFTTGLRIVQMVNFHNRTAMTLGGIVWSGAGRGSLWWLKFSSALGGITPVNRPGAGAAVVR
jgi:hypothetical protein